METPDKTVVIGETKGKGRALFRANLQGTKPSCPMGRSGFGGDPTEECWRTTESRATRNMDSGGLRWGRLLRHPTFQWNSTPTPTFLGMFLSFPLDPNWINGANERPLSRQNATATGQSYVGRTWNGGMEKTQIEERN